MAQTATRNFGRLSEIAQVAVRHGFGYCFETHRLTDLFPRRGPRIEVDVALLYQAARIAKDRVRALDFIDAQQLVDEFARSIRQELDYRLEARNADTFHRNFAGHPHVRVPRVFWTYTRTRVLTLEWIDGVQVVDLDPERWSLEDRRA